MKLLKKIVSALMAAALMATAVPFTAVPASAAVPDRVSDASLVLNRPMASVIVSEVTRVAYKSNSMVQPSGNNSVIVKATPSGLPYVDCSKAPLAYGGETPAPTMISFTPGVELDEQPVITCNNTTVTFGDCVYSNGTYVWEVTGGIAIVGTSLIFTVSYTYSEVNSITGKTYTNTYQTYGISYVEAISSPAGMISSKRTYENFGVGTSTKNRSYIGSYVLGVNTYGSIYNNGTKDGSINFTDEMDWSVTEGWTSEYGTMKNFSGTGASRNYNVAYSADTNRPISYVYMDKSIHSTLSDLNLRLQTVMTGLATETDERVTIKADSLYVTPGITSTFSSDNASDMPANDAAAAAQLGINKFTETISNPGGNAMMYFSGTGPSTSNTTTDYTVAVNYNTPASWANVYVSHSFSVEVKTYDKGALRTLVEEVQGTDPTVMTVTLGEGEYKGYNPQKWYYSYGWESFINAYNAAKSCLSKPDVTQQQIDSAYSTLSSAYASLTLKKADYSLADAYYKQALTKNRSDYTLASWAKLQTIIDNYCDDYSAIYQPAVDKIAVDLKTAMDNLQETTADYSDFLANVSTVNKIMSNTRIKYNNEASEVYSNWSSLVSILKNSGCIYNTTDGYVVDNYLTVSDQPTVDGYTMLLVKAINALKLVGASYVEATKAEAAYNLIKISWVTDDIAPSLLSAYNALVATHGKDISHQNEVDLATAELNYWLENIEYKPADTTVARELIAQAALIDRSLYEDMSGVDTAVSNLRSKLELDIRYQSEINRYVSALRSAIDNLTTNAADYSAVDNAIAAAESIENNIYDTYKSTYGFTADVFYSNWSDVQTAINNVQRGLDVTQQDIVTGYAAEINRAVNALSEAKADYKAVDELQQNAYYIVTNNTNLYTAASLDNLTNVYMSVTTNLKISSQSVVDGFALAIQNAIDDLVYLDASYTAVNLQISAAQEKLALDDSYSNAHPGYRYYTQESVTALEVAIASVETGLDIRSQSTVDGFAANIKAAIDNLELSGADYTQVDLALLQVPEDTSLYTNLTVATLNATINSINRSLKADKQSTVDKYVTSITRAVGNLKYKDSDYTAVNTAISKVPTDQTIYIEDTWTYLQNALDDVVYGLDITHQSQVDTYAQAIENALLLLEFKPGDYTNVYAAIMSTPFDTSMYTDASVAALNQAIIAVVSGLDITHQAEIEEFAKAINEAIEALEIEYANYAAYNDAISAANEKLNSGNYTDKSVETVRNAIKTYMVEEGLDKSHQNEIDDAAFNINASLISLEFKAGDYTQVDEAISIANAKIESGYYTDESVAKLQETIDSIVRDQNITHQSEIDAVNDLIVKATNDLVMKLADYTELQKILDLLDNPDSKIYTILYSNFDDVMSDINDYRANTVSENMNLTIDKQSDVNTMAQTLQGYIDSLEQAYSELQAKAGSTTVIKNNYIYGLQTGLTKSRFESAYVSKQNVTVTYSGSTSSRYLGTGTTVTVTSTITGSVIATYTIVIFGDVDGDGAVNTNDSSRILNAANGIEDSLSAAAKKAANINGDRFTNIADATLIKNAYYGMVSIDQTTGLVK